MEGADCDGLDAVAEALGRNGSSGFGDCVTLEESVALLQGRLEAGGPALEEDFLRKVVGAWRKVVRLWRQVLHERFFFSPISW